MLCSSFKIEKSTSLEFTSMLAPTATSRLIVTEYPNLDWISFSLFP